MKKFLVKIASFLLAALTFCLLVGCTEPLPKLSTPEVAINYEGVAVWSKVEYAIYYAYVIDDGEEQLTDVRTIQLENSQPIKVK
ncbi:MAG: hypothetical protein K2N74_00450, partial [Clostridiales bacterium]|nr:hypothetical protein [Clostridiales bacterium]